MIIPGNENTYVSLRGIKTYGWKLKKDWQACFLRKPSADSSSTKVPSAHQTTYLSPHPRAGLRSQIFMFQIPGSLLEHQFGSIQQTKLRVGERRDTDTSQHIRKCRLYGGEGESTLLQSTQS